MFILGMFNIKMYVKIYISLNFNYKVIGFNFFLIFNTVLGL